MAQARIGPVGALLRRFCVVLALLVPGVAFGVEAPPDSLGADAPASIEVLLQKGEVLRVRSIRTSFQGLHVTTIDGRDSTLSANRVRKITDEKGRDRTKEVLVEEGGIEVGGPDPPAKAKAKAKAPPSAIGPSVSVHAGEVIPVGDFQDLAATGFSIDACLDWRTSLHDTYGLQLELTEFGGDGGLESYFSTGSAGAVDQLRLRFWGASASSRYLIHPDHRFTPFVHTSLGVRRFTTTLSGPSAEGSSTVWGFEQSLGLGVAVRLGKTLGAEFVTAYTRTSTGKSETHADVAAVSSSGTLQCLEFKAGLVRRLRKAP